MLAQQQLSKPPGHQNKQLNYFQEILDSQQIQQMSGADQSGVGIFYKLKNLLFDQNQEEQQIISHIRQQPIKTVGNIIYILTNSYQQKLRQIIDPIEQEKYLLLQKLRQTNEKLQHYIDDNDYFRSLIDRLQQEKKDAELKLNQSIEQIEQSREEIMEQIKERQKIKGLVFRISTDAQQILAENSQLKYANAQYYRQIFQLQTKCQRLQAMNRQMIEINNQITANYNQALNKYNESAFKADQLRNKLHQRQQFITSLIEQYNKAHFFKQYESSGQYKPQQKINDDSEYNELQGFNFNNFDKNSNVSEKSLSKNSSVCQLESDIDQKFQCINATAQKIKPKIPMSHIYVTEQKPYKKSDNKQSSKQKNKFHKEAHPNNKIETVKLSSSKMNKTLVKTVSSKNLKQKQSIMQVTPSQNEGSKMMQDLLKKKIAQKNHKISKLQDEIKYLKEGFIQQRQKITIMEGEYQLQIEELQDQLIFTKKQLSKLYSQYTASNTQRTVYLERAQQLQESLREMDQYYKAYCQQLKRRCKSYVLTRIDQIQHQYETLKSSIKKESASKSKNKTPQEANDSDYKLEYSLQSQGVCEQFQLKFNQDRNREEAHVKNGYMDSFSEIQGYEKLQGHYFNGFQLQFSSKLSNMDHNREEIFVQEQFQIDSNLGAFTQRLINQHKENTINRGNFTERYITSSIHLEKPPLKLSICQNNQKKKLQLISYINTYVINPVIKKLSMYKIEDSNYIFTSKKNLGISENVWNYKNMPRRVMNLQNQTSQYTFVPNNKQLKIELQTCEHIQFPLLKTLTYQTSISYHFVPQHKRLLLNTNMYQITSYPKTKQAFSINKTQEVTIQINRLYNDNEVQTNKIESKAVDSQTEQRLGSHAECQTQKDQKESHSQTEQRLGSHAECQTAIKNLSFRTLLPFTFTPSYQQPFIHQTLQQLEYTPFLNGKHLISLNLQLIQQRSLQQAQSINQESNVSVSEKAIQIVNQNLSTKNDEAPPFLPNYKQVSDSLQWHCQYQKKECLTSYRIYSDHNNIEEMGSNSALNNAICLGQSISKDPKTFNPQSKSYKTQRHNSTQVNISPWFDEKKEQCIQFNDIPKQISTVLTENQFDNLCHYLQSHSLSLFFESKTQRYRFKKPKQIKRKVYFIFAKRNDEQQVFFITSSRIHNLTNNQYIKFQSNNQINNENFMFGQSEVSISGDACLIINRNRKIRRLQGNIEDAIWQIQYYLTCSYRKND